MPFKTDDLNMLNEWLVAGPESALAKATERQPVSTRLLGENISSWLDVDGMPQSRMGSQPLMVELHYGYLWVCPSGTPARPLFAFPEFSQPGRRILDCGGFGVHVSGLRVIENFLDMAHFPFVHTNYLGKVPHTEVADYKVSVDPETEEIWATDCRFWQPKASAMHAGGSDVVYQYRVMQPFSAMLYKSSNKEGLLDAIGLFVQPVDEDRVIAHTVLAYFDEVSTDAELIAFQHTIFGQDKPILENHLPKRMPLEGRFETQTRGDAMSVAFRRMLRTRGLRFGVHPA